MDVCSYFENVLSTSYMVRVQFSNADYDELDDASQYSSQGSLLTDRPSSNPRIKRGNSNYTSQKLCQSEVRDGRVSETIVENLVKKKASQSSYGSARKKRDESIDILIAKHILRSTTRSFDDDCTHEALLVIPASVSTKDGSLSYPGDWNSASPWIPRMLLDEGHDMRGVEKADILIGTYAAYKSYVSSSAGIRRRVDNASQDDQWRTYCDYAEGLYQKVFSCSQEELAERELRVDDDSIYLLINNAVNASAPIERLYQRIRTQGSKSNGVALFNSMTRLEPREQTVARLPDDGFDEIVTHAGTASREYPLADSQRLALHRQNQLPEGEALAVSGPPGTGKTTLLQSIVADLLVHRALAAKPVPPIIVGTSTNNQAVTNIVDAFTKDVKQAEGDSVFRRWLPDIVSDKDGKGCIADESKPLRSLGVFSPSGAKKGEADKKGYLLDDVSRRHDGLYQQCIDQHYNAVAEKVYRRQAGAFLGKEFSSVGQALRGVHELHQKIDKLRKDLTKSVENKSYPQRCSDLIYQLTRYGAVDAKGNSIPLEACNSLKSLDKALDTTVRPLEFWLAIHVFEGMWLTAKKLKDTPPKRELHSYQEEIMLKYRRQMAALMPLTVMTMYRLPGQFEYAGPDRQRNRSLFGCIDLLIVDEAGQVDMSVGAAAFSLAKRAVVVGDVYQLPPVWGLEPEADFMIAQGFMDEKEDQVAVWDALRAQGLTASRNSSVMAAAQASCRWCYEAGTTTDDDDDSYSLWDDEDDDEDEESKGGLFLSEHRRCMDSIISYCNDLLYGGKLEPMRGNSQGAEIGLPAMGFCPIEGKAVPSGTSRKNPAEASAVALWISQHITQLWDAYNSASGGKADPKKIIGVVTPFSSQANEVRSQLRRLGRVRLGEQDCKLVSIVTVGTAHRLQGAECPVVLFSLVYDAQSTPGFVENNPNLMNVAVSRAKDAFIVFGCEELMSQARGNGVMGLLKYYCYDHKVEPPSIEDQSPRRRAPQGPTSQRSVTNKPDASKYASTRFRPNAITTNQEECDYPQPAPPKSHHASSVTVRYSSPDGWAGVNRSLSLTQARKASMADGFWPRHLATTAIGEINGMLEKRGVLTRDGKHWVPTPAWKARGVGIGQGKDGGKWPVYTESAIRAIVQLL